MPGGLGREPLAALRVGGEQVAEVEVPDRGEVALERAPRRPFAERRGHPGRTSGPGGWSSGWVSPRLTPWSKPTAGPRGR